MQSIPPLHSSMQSMKLYEEPLGEKKEKKRKRNTDLCRCLYLIALSC